MTEQFQLLCIVHGVSVCTIFYYINAPDTIESEPSKPEDQGTEGLCRERTQQEYEMWLREVRPKYKYLKQLRL